MPDLKKINEKFQGFLTDGLNEEEIKKLQVPELSEELFETPKEIKWRYVSLRYFLVLEDEEPVVYIRAYSTVHDLDETFIVDETSIKHDPDGTYFKKRNENFGDKFRL